MLKAISEIKLNNLNNNVNHGEIFEDKNIGDIDNKNIKEEDFIKKCLKEFTRKMNIEKLKQISNKTDLSGEDNNINNSNLKLDESNTNTLLDYYLNKLSFKSSSERNNQISYIMSKIAMDYKNLNFDDLLNKASEINKKSCN